MLYILYSAQHGNQHKDALALSTMIHVVRKQIKYILVNERPRDISRARAWMTSRGFEKGNFPFSYSTLPPGA